MNFYVFRIDYGACYDLIKKELLEHKVLRQGWGFDNMDIRNGEDAFVQTWNEYGKSRYAIISNMLNMNPGDIIVVPKLDTDSPLGDWKTSYRWARTFTIARCTEGYSFAPISTAGYGNDVRNDFGHMIGVERIASFSYDYNDASRIISAKFKAYRKPVNNVYNADFIKAAESLIAESKSGSDTHSEKASLEALSGSRIVIEARNDYLKKILGIINGWKSDQLENFEEAQALFKDTLRFIEYLNDSKIFNYRFYLFL